jgi:hypothetical protein
VPFPSDCPSILLHWQINRGHRHEYRLALGARVVWIGKDDYQPSGPGTITRITARQVEVLGGTKPRGAIAARSCITFDILSSFASSMESGSTEGATCNHAQGN